MKSLGVLTSGLGKEDFKRSRLFQFSGKKAGYRRNSGASTSNLFLLTCRQDVTLLENQKKGKEASPLPFRKHVQVNLVCEIDTNGEVVGFDIAEIRTTTCTWSKITTRSTCEVAQHP